MSGATGMMGQMGGPMDASQFSTASGNPLLSPQMLSGSTIAGQMDASGQGGGGGFMSKLPQMLGPSTSLLGQMGKMSGGGGGGGGGGTGAGRGYGEAASGAQMLASLASIISLIAA